MAWSMGKRPEKLRKAYKRRREAVVPELARGGPAFLLSPKMVSGDSKNALPLTWQKDGPGQMEGWSRRRPG